MLPTELLSKWHTDTDAEDVVQGNLIVGQDIGGGVVKWKGLSGGANGTFLRMDSQDPVWADIDPGNVWITMADNVNTLEVSHADPSTADASNDTQVVQELRWPTGETHPCLEQYLANLQFDSKGHFAGVDTTGLGWTLVPDEV
jgi:hypothetical protein